MRSADFTRTAATLPALYHEDPASYQQLDGYLGLADAIHEAMLELLEDLEFGEGPDAALRWPTDVPLDAGRGCAARSPDVPVRRSRDLVRLRDSRIMGAPLNPGWQRGDSS